MLHTPSQPPSVVATAPWTLHGNALMLLYYFPKHWGKTHGQLLGYQVDTFRGGVAALMCVDYHDSPVGPYQELLFIPGALSIANRRPLSISRILVSTYESVWNGINNWGIPKTLGSFAHTRKARSQNWEVTEPAGPVCSLKVTESSFRFPVNTSLIPLPVYQQANNKGYFTRPVAKGTARWCRLQSFEGFGDLANRRPLAVLSIENFTMQFPVPEVVAV